MNRILDYLDLLYPNAFCELNYNKDYELLIAIVLSAQTTDKRVNKVTKVLFSKYNSLEELANANISDIEEIIREIGSFRKKSVYVKDICNKLISDGYNYVPNDRDYLMSLSGVGRKTVNVFISVFYGEAAIGVDTHVDRVSKRLGLALKDDNKTIVEEKLMRVIPRDRWSIVHHQLVLFGRYKCTSRKPMCLSCGLRDICKKDDI